MGNTIAVWIQATSKNRTNSLLNITDTNKPHMALFHQPVSKIQLARTLGMSESTLRREINRKNIEIEHHCRLSPKEAEELVIKLGYDPIDEVLFQRAKKVQDDYPLGD